MNNKNIFISWLIVILTIIVGMWLYSRPLKAPSINTSRSFITTVTYSCDHGKKITASYFKGPEMPQPKPGEMPHPTGSVDVSINGAPTTTLSQTISADGIRYANNDESLVFWSKGNNALIMRNNSMDLNYTNCTAIK